MKSRKELIADYKQKKFKMGVFQIRNTLNNKVFIEGSANLDSIWNRHRMQLNFGNHPNAALQKEWNESGESNFTYEIIAELNETEDKAQDYNKEIKLLEDLYIAELRPFGEKGYH